MTGRAAAIRRYGPVAQLLHWLTAAFVLLAVPVGLLMTTLEYGPAKTRIYEFHESLGLTIAALTIFRLAWRVARPPPPHPTTLSKPLIRLIGAVHCAIYLLLLGMPVAGWLGSSAFGFPPKWFWLIQLPALIQRSDAIGGLLLSMHSFMGYALIALVGLHVAGVARNHLIERDATLLRMLPGDPRP